MRRRPVVPAPDEHPDASVGGVHGDERGFALVDAANRREPVLEHELLSLFLQVQVEGRVNLEAAPGEHVLASLEEVRELGERLGDEERSPVRGRLAAVKAIGWEWARSRMYARPPQTAPVRGVNVGEIVDSLQPRASLQFGGFPQLQRSRQRRVAPLLSLVV